MVAGASTGPLCQSVPDTTANREAPEGVGPDVTRAVGSISGVGVLSGTTVGTRVRVAAGGGVGRSIGVLVPPHAASSMPATARLRMSFFIVENCTIASTPRLSHPLAPSLFHLVTHTPHTLFNPW
jgi:hypothetical protein